MGKGKKPAAKAKASRARSAKRAKSREKKKAKILDLSTLYTVPVKPPGFKSFKITFRLPKASVRVAMIIRNEMAGPDLMADITEFLGNHLTDWTLCEQKPTLEVIEGIQEAEIISEMFAVVVNESIKAGK